MRGIFIMKIMLDKIKKIKYNRMSSAERYIIYIFNNVVVVNSDNITKYYIDDDPIMEHNLISNYFYISWKFGEKLYSLDNKFINIRLEKALQKYTNEILSVNVKDKIYFKY